jgi:ankyrin repeat protein
LHGDLDGAAARALIDLGANVNAQNKSGETPLMWSSSERIVETLLNAGADFSLRSNAGKSALDLARERHLPKIVDLIEKADNSGK